MTDYPERPGRRVTLGQLRKLAVAALANYDLPPVRLTLLSNYSNTTFRVDSAGERRFVLRIHQVGSPTVARVGAELAWLSALRRDTPLQVPLPVPTRAGPLLAEAAAPGLPAPLICVLFQWQAGRRLVAGLTPRYLERVGELMAHLHDHALHWPRPPGFTRGRVDWPSRRARFLPDPFAPEIVAALVTLVADRLSAAEAAQVRAVLERVRAVEQALGQGPAAFGLIHADLHYNNLLFARDTVRAIDFDDCGFGPLLYDPGVTLYMLQDHAAYPALRAALLAGYRRVRPLSAEHETYLDTFIALRCVQDAVWELETPHDPAPAAWAAQARAYLAAIPGCLPAPES